MRANSLNLFLTGNFFFFFFNSTLKRKDYLLVCCGWFAEASSSVEQETVCPYSLTHYEKVL